MNSTVRAPVALVLSVTVVLTVSCGLGGSSGVAPVSTASPAACSTPPRCLVDRAVPMPGAFPIDFPVYPGARLTEASLNAGVPLSGQSSWGMVWETLDSTMSVEAYYAANLDQSRWVIVLSGRPNGSYVAIFNSRARSAAGGMLGIFISSGVTYISLALTLD